MDGLRPVFGMGEALGEEGVEASALAPHGWNCAVEADALMAEAAALAADERLWVRKADSRDVCWEAMRLQVGRGMKQSDVARIFGVHPHTLINHKMADIRGGRTNKTWGRLTFEELRALSRVVAGATVIRRRVLDIEVDDAARARDAKAFDWMPLDVAPAALESSTPPAEADTDALDLAYAPQTIMREEARRVLGAAHANAVMLGDAGRAEAIDAALAACETERAAGALLSRWDLIAGEAQRAPTKPWRTWLLMGGRGAGKTRTGAEWVRGLVEGGFAKRVALVGPSLHDVREVMIAGPSGLLEICAPGMRPKYEVTRRRLVWPPHGLCAGAVAFAFSAEDPDSLRGPQFDAAWCDEIGAWANDLETWRTLAFGMRLGSAPRIVATTPPRPRALVKLLVGKAEAGRGGVVLTQAATRANAHNLSPEFVAALEEDYGGTPLGRQELDGELIEDLEGALWTRAMIEAARCSADEAAGLERVVVAVDPPAGAGARSDACGIVVAGVKDGVVYVLADATVRGLRPAEWAKRVAAAAETWGAGLVVAEANQGGEMVRDVLEAAGEGAVRVKLEHASKGKRDRAEPVSAKYEQGRVRHVRVLKELEDEMCSFGAPGQSVPRSRSPDRVDALVWAVTVLTRKPPAKPGVDVL